MYFNGEDIFIEKSDIDEIKKDFRISQYLENKHLKPGYFRQNYRVFKQGYTCGDAMTRFAVKRHVNDNIHKLPVKDIIKFSLLNIPYQRDTIKKVASIFCNKVLGGYSYYDMDGEPLRTRVAVWQDTNPQIYQGKRYVIKPNIEALEMVVSYLDGNSRKDIFADLNIVEWEIQQVKAVRPREKIIVTMKVYDGELYFEYEDKKINVKDFQQGMFNYTTAKEYIYSIDVKSYEEIVSIVQIKRKIKGIIIVRKSFYKCMKAHYITEVALAKLSGQIPSTVCYISRQQTYDDEQEIHEEIKKIIDEKMHTRYNKKGKATLP